MVFGPCVLTTGLKSSSPLGDLQSPHWRRPSQLILSDPVGGTSVLPSSGCLGLTTIPAPSLLLDLDQGRFGHTDCLSAVSTVNGKLAELASYASLPWAPGHGHWMDGPVVSAMFWLTDQSRPVMIPPS